jgi:hypothetical protein
MNRLALRILCLAVVSLAVSSTAHAQRALRWDSIDVAAHLGNAGELRVTETQTMVFTGPWNGGERKFTLHPRQKLTLLGLYRDDGGTWRRLTEDSRLDDVDDFAWPKTSTLRWRSRRTLDPAFSETFIRYELRYVVSAVVSTEGDGYRLDHDFAFADRDGTIDRFTLRFTHDPEWQPMSDVRAVYTAGPLPPGRTFVLNFPLRHTGPVIPATLDTRSAAVRIAAATLLGVPALLLIWFFIREQSHGRFAPLETGRVDETWLRDNILKHSAETIGAAWDGRIGKVEVVALIARMVGEHKLASAVDQDSQGSSMALTLTVDRSTLEGHERALVDGLFFDGRTETTTELVKAHYSDQGFDPVKAIKPGLEEEVKRLLPEGKRPRAFRIESLVLFVIGAGLLLVAAILGNPPPLGAVMLSLGALLIGGIGWIAGAIFRDQIRWGRRAALICLIPAVTLAAGTAALLWFYEGAGNFQLSAMTLAGIVALTLALTNASVNVLRSRQSRDAIALRKRLIAARDFFMSELRKERPALKDDWYPWALAFGLATQLDDWSAKRPVTAAVSDRPWLSDATRPTSDPSSAPSAWQWDGFSGGRSGGAGGGASWAAAAGGIAARVSAPGPSGSGSSGHDRSDSSDGGWSGGSSGGGVSSGGSSGGGGGGGW